VKRARHECSGIDEFLRIKRECIMETTKNGKGTLFLLGMFCMALAFGLMAAGCNNGSTDPGSGIETAATPTASPAAGAVTSFTPITLSTGTEGAAIRYTTDGSTPSAESTAYSEPVIISAATTIKAIAIKSGMADSAVLTAAYTISGQQNSTVATPTASLADGAVTAFTTITLSTGTEGGTILYTTNGSTPPAGSAVYTEPVVINTATTIKAIAIKSGMVDSGVLTAAYTIKDKLYITRGVTDGNPTPVPGPEIVIEDTYPTSSIVYPVNPGSTSSSIGSWNSEYYGKWYSNNVSELNEWFGGITDPFPLTIKILKTHGTSVKEVKFWNGSTWNYISGSATASLQNFDITDDGTYFIIVCKLGSGFFNYSDEMYCADNPLAFEFNQ
jgi:hypothetical protein